MRSAFEAFAGRDLDAMLRVSHPDIVLRPHQSTTELTGRRAPYRGHDGLRAYTRDVNTVWKSLTLIPTAFRPAHQSVIVFGRAEARSGTETHTVYVLWVWQLRDGLIASIEVFQTPHRHNVGLGTVAAFDRPERVERRVQDRLAIIGVSRDLGDGGDHVEDLPEGQIVSDLA